MRNTDDDIFKYYEGLAPDYDQDRFENSYGQFIHTQEEALLKTIVSDKEHVLDLACGTGRFMHLATEGLDVSPAMLEETAKKYPEKHLHCASAWQMPLADNRFDTVFSMHLLMHLTKVRFQDILHEVHRVLAQDGLFIFDVPAYWRRKMMRYQTNGWHGNTAYDIQELKEMTKKDWEWIRYYGVVFFPIHHLTPHMRQKMLPVDSLLCKSFFKYFASYYLIVLRKKS